MRVHGLGNPKNKSLQISIHWLPELQKNYSYWGRLGSNDDKCELNPTHDEEKVGPEGPPEKDPED